MQRFPQRSRRASWQMASPSRSQSSQRMSHAARRASAFSITSSGSQSLRTPVTSAVAPGSMSAPSAQLRQPLCAAAKSRSSRWPVAREGEGGESAQRCVSFERASVVRKKMLGRRAGDGGEAHVALRALDGAAEGVQRVVAHAGAAESVRALSGVGLARRKRRCGGARAACVRMSAAGWRIRVQRVRARALRSRQRTRVAWRRAAASLH